MLEIRPRVVMATRHRHLSRLPRLLMLWRILGARILLFCLDRGCTHVRILRLPKLPVAEVLDGLLDGSMSPSRGPFLELLAWLHEVIEDPGALGLAHGITACEVRELPRDEPFHVARLELLCPATEVLWRVQRGEVIVEDLVEVPDALLLLLDVPMIHSTWMFFMVVPENLPGRRDVGS